MLTTAQDARHFVQEWKRYGKRGNRMIKEAAQCQRSNLEAIGIHSINPDWCDVDKYEAAVQLLEEAAAAIDKKEAR